MKNIFTVFIAITSSLVFLYILLFFYTFYNFDNEFKHSFKSLENLNIHKKYSNKIHHVREEINLENYFLKTSHKDLVYTVINSNIKNNLQVLFQGDSWFEQINGAKETNFFSYQLIESFGKNNKINFINAAASSYSPTLMQLQIDVLEKDFEIYPDIVVAYIDQLNIGDEVCRYKKNKILKDGVLISVKAEQDFSGAGWYNYSKIYGISGIYFSDDNKVIKTLKLINFKFQHQINNVFKRLATKNKKIQKCYFDQIEKHLLLPTKSDLIYFENVLNNYIEKVLEKKHIKKLILVSFPYKKHFENTYKYNISDTVDKVLNKHENVIHINFSEDLLKDETFKFQDIWLSDKIHLNADMHANLFIKTILSEIRKIIN